MILPRKSYPACLLPHLEVVKGIYAPSGIPKGHTPSGIPKGHVGGCRWGDEFERGALAHAHTAYNDRHGWICLSTQDLLADESTLLHEVAHLYTPSQAGHNDTWRRHVVRIGGSLDGTELDFKEGYAWGYHKELRVPIKVGQPRWMAYQHHPKCPCGNQQLKPWGGQALRLNPLSER